MQKSPQSVPEKAADAVIWTVAAIIAVPLLVGAVVFAAAVLFLK